ncbi:AraC family transcriptional regulator [Pseudomonas sp. RIT-PI-AD]|uniref:AraC family transcriptional regulator GliR n=1 Tax=Pseudomonas sp. RIT-PI-AD TaxID=3035294 RepID=UPI0021D80AFD|nr:AraC family transcriptional regulator [Pseudomonas sp. RIT-PI-AD]
MHALGYTAVPVLSKYLRYAEHLGLDTAAALREAGIAAQALADNNARLPSEAHERLLEHLLRRSADPLFGLRAARFVQPGSWSVLGYITMNCATLGEAMGRIVPYEKLVGDMGVSRVEASAGLVRLIWSCRHRTAEIRRHMVENVLASWLLYARWIADTERSPREVWFSHRQPPGVALEAYQDVFGCPVRFEQDCDALLIPREYLDLPLRLADAHLLRTLEAHALGLMAELSEDEPLPQRVKAALRALLKDGLPRKERVADKFGMTLRTLQRHLQQEGTSYQRLLDELRRELAEHYLLRSDLAIQEIACYLGFSEPRSFHRSFKLWTGSTPGEYRDVQRQGQPDTPRPAAFTTS